MRILPFLSIVLVLPTLVALSEVVVAQPAPAPGATPGGGAVPGAIDPAVAPEAAANPSKTLRPNARVSFNLEDAELNELVKLVSEITGRRFIIPGKIRSIKATVFAPRDVTAAEVYRAFLTILEVNGLTVVPAGAYLKIVETGGVETQPLQTSTPGGNVPSDERFVTHLHRPEYVTAEAATELLTRFKSRDGNISAQASTNLVILTDTGVNIRRMLGILEAVDVPRTGEQLWIEPVHYANANDLAETIQKIYPAEEGGEGAKEGKARARAASSPSSDSPSTPPSDQQEAGASNVGLTKIFGDDRTNSLVILASQRAYLRVLELIRRFDTPLEGGGRMRVHQLQHSDSEEVAKTLESLINGGGSSGSRSRPAEGANQSGAAKNVRGEIFEGDVRVMAHKTSNALVITSSMRDYATVRQVVNELDAPRRQVFIEAVVMELLADNGSELGLSYHGGIPNVARDGSLSVVGFNARNSIAPASALTNQSVIEGVAAGITGPLVANSQQLFGVSIPAFGVMLNAVARSGNTNIMATPHIIALDNKKAEISVGKNIPLQTSGVPPGTFGGLGNAAVLGQTAGQNPGGGFAGGLTGAVPRQDIGTTIRITPHISDKTSIRLEIQEEISEQGNAVGTLGVVPITQRRASTEVSVEDQQTIVIGGLMREVDSVQETKVPVLGDIPLLGFLFRTRKKAKEKTNLLLILTPYIIRTPADLRAIFERKMRERQEFIDRFFVFTDESYEPPIDYSRTRGLVAEIFREIDLLSEEARLISSAEKARPQEHQARPPVPTEPPAAASTKSITSTSPDEFVPQGPAEELRPNATPGSPSASGPSAAATPD